MHLQKSRETGNLVTKCITQKQPITSKVCELLGERFEDFQDTHWITGTLSDGTRIFVMEKDYHVASQTIDETLFNQFNQE
jgi:hypothetical protein